jgi:MFS family permease
MEMLKPTHPQAYRALVIITLINLLNYIDRYLVAAVMPAMSAELKLSNTQIGFILSAFMLGYFFTSPLFGYLADRYSRVKIIGAGTLVWSLATGVIGYCNTSLQILLSRVVVGVGEASTVSTSQVLLSDYFKPQQKNQVMGLFLAAVPVGAALGYILGGQLATHWSWRAAFFVALWPGLLLSALIFFIKDPRGKILASSPTGTPHMAQFRKDIGHLLKNKRYMFAVWGNTAFTFTLGGFASWIPQYMVKVRGAELNKTNMLFGLITVATGLIGSIAGGSIASYFLKKRPRGDLYFIFILIVISIIPSFFAFYTQNNDLFFILIAFSELLLFATQPTANVVFIETAPHAIQSMALALAVFLMHLLGDLISPPLVGLLADIWDLQRAILILPLALIFSAYFFWKSYKLIKATPAEAK